MKPLIVVLMSVLSLASFAKMQVFTNVDAIKFVMNDSQLLDDVLRKSKTNNLESVAIENAEFNMFNVVLTTEAQAENGGLQCKTSVLVNAITKKIQIPGGGTITANELASKAFDPSCVKK